MIVKSGSCCWIIVLSLALAVTIAALVLQSNTLSALANYYDELSETVDSVGVVANDRYNPDLYAALVDCAGGEGDFLCEFGSRWYFCYNVDDPSTQAYLTGISPVFDGCYPTGDDDADEHPAIMEMK